MASVKTSGRERSGVDFSRALTWAVNPAINMNRTPEPAKLRPTPGLGEHSEEVLRELGYNEAAIADLRARDIV